MDIAEALTLGEREEARIHRTNEVLRVAVQVEKEVKELRKERDSLVSQITRLNQQRDQKETELNDMIAGMTITAEAQAKKAQDNARQLKEHCDEQMVETRKNYVEEKAKLSQELGDLRAQKEQELKAIKKLHMQLEEVKTQISVQEHKRPDDLTVVTESNLKRTQAELAKAKERLAKERQEYVAQRTKMDRELGDMQAERDQLSKALEALNDRKREIDEAAKDLMPVEDSPDHSAVNTQAEIATKKRELKKITAELDETRNRAGEERKKLAKETGDLKAQNAQLRRENEKLKSEQASLNEQAVRM